MKKKLLPEQQQWLDEAMKKAAVEPNPCRRKYGKGPEVARCKSCIHLFSHHPGKNRYYKCDFRGCTHGPGTDHRINWKACGKYQRKENDNE